MQTFLTDEEIDQLVSDESLSIEDRTRILKGLIQNVNKQTAAFKAETYEIREGMDEETKKILDGMLR